MTNAAIVQILDRWAGSLVGEVDSALLARFLTERDEEAFATLVHRHGSLVYGTCRRILGNHADADDAFQAIFFVLARRAHTLKQDRSIGPWLHGVAVRVATKLRNQLVQRRLREMSAARSERKDAAEIESDFWAIIDEELARMPLPLREVVLLCDLSGQSHSQAAESLRLAKGTITKRLTRAHEELAIRLKRRGITLGLGAMSTMLATRATATVPASLLSETASQAVAFSIGRIDGLLTAQTLAEGVMRSIKAGALQGWLVVGLIGLTLAGGGLMLAGTPVKPGEQKREQPKATADAKPDVVNAGTMWKESFTTEYESSLPVSAAFSEDAKTLLTGDTGGDVMAVQLGSDPPTYRWKTKVEGSHPAVAYSADQKVIYATAKDGVKLLDAGTGIVIGTIAFKDRAPVAIGVFPDDVQPGIANGAKELRLSKVVFGDAFGYHVHSGPAGGLHVVEGGIDTNTGAKGAKTVDLSAVPLAVDPKGRSAIMTGPIDATGDVAGMKGKNVLWAYVCGDYAKDSPGNRVMTGHTATVVSAAWAKEGGTAVTGDASGRVIVWDAKTMKEARRVEFGGRILAVAVSSDGTHTAACVRGKQGGEFFVWETAKPANAMRPIHNQQGDFGGEPHASLAFSSDGKQLTGCAIDKKWLQLDGKPRICGQVHVWELAAEPKSQLPPNYLYDLPLTKDNSAQFVIADNATLLMIAPKEGAIDLRDIKDGHIQARLVLGKFALGGMKLSSDRKWLAMEQHAVTNENGIGIPAELFDVGVYAWPPRLKATIPSCSQMLDVASDGKVVAVVRDKQIELWDTETAKLLKPAPFKHTRIDAAQFSPDGKLLAISDANGLVLWQWEENKHERIDLGRRVGSLIFSPDGKFLAEGPTPGENIHIRDMETRKVVQSFANDSKRSMNVPRMAFTQGGRVLIGCDSSASSKEIGLLHRIILLDTTSGAIAHQIALPAGLPASLDVSPNGRYLAAMLDDGDAGLKLRVWRLDGKTPLNEPMQAFPPATAKP